MRIKSQLLWLCCIYYHIFLEFYPEFRFQLRVWTVVMRRSRTAVKGGVRRRLQRVEYSASRLMLSKVIFGTRRAAFEENALATSRQTHNI